MATYPTYPISRNSNSTCYTIYPERGGKIVLDQETPEMFVQLMCGTSGSIIVQSKSGDLRYYPSVVAGYLLVAPGVKVLTEATIDGEAVATTAADIWWYGGQ